MESLKHASEIGVYIPNTGSHSQLASQILKLHENTSYEELEVTPAAAQTLKRAGADVVEMHSGIHGEEEWRYRLEYKGKMFKAVAPVKIREFHT